MSSAYKLHIRQAMCFMCLGQDKIADICWEKANSAASSIDSNEARENALQFIRTKYAEKDVVVPAKDSKGFASNCKDYSIAEPHPLYPAFTKKVRYCRAPGQVQSKVRSSLRSMELDLG